MIRNTKSKLQSTAKAVLAAAAAAALLTSAAAPAQAQDYPPIRSSTTYYGWAMTPFGYPVPTIMQVKTTVEFCDGTFGTIYEWPLGYSIVSSTTTQTNTCP